MPSTSNNVLVSGATSGIGLELAKELIIDGKCVYAIGRNHEKFLNTIHTWALKNNYQHLCHWIELDFSSTSDISTGELDTIPELSGFINCAGILPISPLKMQKSDDIIDTININLLSPILLTRELLKSKKIMSNSSLIYLSSINGVRVGSKAHTSYAATKAGISGFVMSLANELSNSGIRVNAIAPATVDTPMLHKTKMLIGEKNFLMYADQYPLGIGKPQSIIPIIKFLLNEECSKWITGQTFVIDGGFSLN